MLTPDDIRDVVFTKIMGGYKTSEVDLFIDDCADTVETLIEEKNTALETMKREKQELQKKLEVLADKLVEYRNDEESIRTALLGAQRLGDETLREAKHKAKLILDDARIKAEKIVEKARNDITKEEKELERAQKEVSLFKSRMLSMYREHIALINLLPESQAAEEEPAPEAPAAPEQPAEPEVTVTVTDETPAAEQAVAESKVAAEEKAKAGSAAQNPQIEEVQEVPLVAPAEEPAHPASRFENLKFGDEYDLANDPDGDKPRGLFRRKK